MIKELKAALKKYEEMSRNSEYVSIAQVKNDLFRLMMEARLKRIPKSER